MVGHPKTNEDGGSGVPLSTVFVVDDDAAHRRRVSEQLETTLQGTRVIELGCLDDGLRLWGEHQPECVLLPERLLGESGRVLFELLAGADGATSPPLVVVIAEDSSGGLRARALRSVVSEWTVRKDLEGPVEADLSSVVGALLNRRDRRREETRRAYSERLGTLRRIFAKAAHEINNPAAIIRLAIAAVSDAIEARAPDSAVQSGASSLLSSEDVNRLRELVQSADDALGRITLGLRNLENEAGISLGHQTSLTMDGVVQGAKTQLLEKDRPLLDLSFELDAADEFFGDKDQLVRLVLDLVDNALEAAAPGGRVVVKTSVEGRRAVVSVEDSGAGVDVELLDDIFEPLFSTRSDRGALGMGLARVWGIVERHGGTIRVGRSELGGARFVVKIPLEGNEEPLSVASSQVIPPSGTEHGPRILIIDDEPQIRDSYSRVLRRHFEVDVASSSVNALSLVEERAYALILCDVIMPGEDGVDFAQRLVRDFPDHASVLLFCTGGVLEAPQERFLTMWENGFLRKPMSAAELVNSVSTFIESKSRLPLELEKPAS